MAVGAAAAIVEKVAGIEGESGGHASKQSSVEHEGVLATHGKLPGAKHGPRIKNEDEHRDPEHGDQGRPHLNAVKVRRSAHGLDCASDGALRRHHGSPGPPEEQQVRHAHRPGLEEERCEEAPAEPARHSLRAAVLGLVRQPRDQEKAGDADNKVDRGFAVLIVGHDAAHPVELLRSRGASVEPKPAEERHSALGAQRSVAAEELGEEGALFLHVEAPQLARVPRL
mmetsp:Transcript_2700/g.8141  ORF Transcript_2700/g.8141 Transcript_2700/m.8141 type:complete len:226 (+) Transcript_2700:214-891(+)